MRPAREVDEGVWHIPQRAQVEIGLDRQVHGRVGRDRAGGAEFDEAAEHLGRNRVDIDAGQSDHLVRSSHAGRDLPGWRSTVL